MKRKNNFFLTLCKWTFVLSIWITLLLGTTTIWAFINLPETESIKITRQPSITFLDREGRILALRYGFYDGVPRTLEEIGEEFDLTRERIRQLEKLALCRLRHPSFGIREQDLV